MTTIKANNIVILTGNLGKDPEVRRLESGTAVAKFSIATNDGYKSKESGEYITQTEWHNIIVWRGTAEYVERNFHKGDLVQLLGKLTHRSYETQSGETRYVTEIVASSLYKLGGSEEKKNNTGYFPKEEPGAADTGMHHVPEGDSGSTNGPTGDPADDLPF